MTKAFQLAALLALATTVSAAAQQTSANPNSRTAARGYRETVITKTRLPWTPPRTWRARTLRHAV